jgi:diguanylate cyclase (GGDEF)-like protein/PAS domain S-box-containing protein
VTDRDDPAQAYEELLQFFYLCPVGIVKFAPDGRIDMVNPLAAQLLMPLTRDAELENIFTVLSDWVPELPVLVRDFGADAGMLFEQRRVATGAGPRQRVLSMTVNRIARPTFMAVIQDVTDAALKERRIHEDQQRFRAIFDQIQDYAIYTLDLEGRIVDWNRTLQRLGGWTAEDVVGKHVSIFFPPSEFDANASGQVLTRAARRGSVEIEGRRVRKDGSEYWGDAVVTALPDKDGNVTGFVVISRDISEQKKREDELLRMATTDPLTGAFNRRYAGERLAEAFDRHKRYANPATAMMIDIDHFKKVNDTYGHDAGDIMLQGLAQLLLGQLRGADMVARWGGEEFLVLMPETRAEPAAVVASRILAAVRATPFVLADGRRVSITVSIGMASLTPEIASGDELVKRADNALYEAKSGGRDRLVSA